MTEPILEPDKGNGDRYGGFVLPRGPGTAVFSGGGTWLPRGKGGRGWVGDEAVVLARPDRTILARGPDDIVPLLREIEAAQHQGCYVAGYLAYEAGAAFGLTVQTPDPEALPLAWAAIYPSETAVVIPSTEWAELLGAADVERVRRSLEGVVPRLSVDREAYVQAIAQVREYIAAGDTYQINYTVRGRYELAGEAVDPLDLFLALVVRQAVPYAAYLDLGDAQVISLSPEMFLRRSGDRLESRPMKGTRPRGITHVQDVALAYELAETEKERAENLMIVDMVRNDLGRVSLAGTVRVPTLYAVEPYRTVWQMVSTVTGELRSDTSLLSIMKAVFPGASITGAPKHHTMELISRLETEPRDVYTGTVALFCPGRDFTSSIAIRTVIHRHGACKLGTGSGVVWDAESASEYEETLAKAAFAIPPKAAPWRPDRRARLDPEVHGADGSRLFETILLQPRDWEATMECSDGTIALSPSLSMSDAAVFARYVFADEHLDRMASSAEELGFPFDREVLRSLLIGQARLSAEALVVHVDLTPDGCFSLSTRGAPDTGDASLNRGEPTRPPVDLLVSPFRTDPDDPLLRHKTGARGFYNRERRRAVQQGCFDALFLNRLDRVTEGAITNLFARFGAEWVTPPVRDGLLPGIWRAMFLEAKGARERSLTLEELTTADEILVGNSVRGAIPVDRLLADPVVF